MEKILGELLFLGGFLSGLGLGWFRNRKLEKYLQDDAKTEAWLRKELEELRQLYKETRRKLEDISRKELEEDN